MTAKKRLLVVFIAAVAVGATAALVFIFQFFGDAVRERSDLYISARTDYPGLLDSLRPRTDHHWAFDRYAGRLELELLQTGALRTGTGNERRRNRPDAQTGDADARARYAQLCPYPCVPRFAAGPPARCRFCGADAGTDRPAACPGGRDRQPAALFALHPQYI